MNFDPCRDGCRCELCQIKKDVSGVFLELITAGRAGDRAKMNCAMLMFEKIGFVNRRSHEVAEKMGWCDATGNVMT